MSAEPENSEAKIHAENNSVSVGSLQIGGNVEGAIHIGHKTIININDSTSLEAAGGLFALHELMSHSKDVHTAVITFQADFRGAHEQVERLGDYKDLHDLLHRLQFHCYNGISLAVTRFPNDELTLDTLNDHALTLEEISRDLKKVATRPSIPKHELTWIDEIDVAVNDLHRAVEKLDESFLKKVIWRLGRLLNRQPARINALLISSADTFRLPALLSALLRVQDTLTSFDMDAEKVNIFQKGTDALGKLNETLSLIVGTHNQWQLVDIELRRIEAFIERDLDELQMSWADVKEKAEPLYGNFSDDWASALKKEQFILDDALNNASPIKIRRSFRNFQRRAMERFFRVDAELKTLCGALRQIGVPLTAVLEMIR